MGAELQRLQAKQLKRLHQAAEAAQVDLGPGWTAEVKVRQQGTTAGIMQNFGYFTLLLRETHTVADRDSRQALQKECPIVTSRH